MEFLAEAIADKSLMIATDGSFMVELILSYALRRFSLSVPKGEVNWLALSLTLHACAYRGELLGLLAVHLILLAVNKTRPQLRGSVRIYSDCLGALNSVVDIPVNRIPSGTPHSDILKTLMIHCSDYTFRRHFSHVSAHTQRSLPLEPITMFVDNQKMTSDTGDLRFHAHRILAKEFFTTTTVQSKKSLPLLSAEAFEAIDWPNVYYVLHHVPRLFQLFACKQVTGVAGTNAFVHRYDKSRNPMCPSCHSCRETTAHILFCHERIRQDLSR